MKESRTSIDDRREIIPKCIITVSKQHQVKTGTIMSICTHTGDTLYEDVTQVVMDSTGTTYPRSKQNLLWNCNVEKIHNYA